MKWPLIAALSAGLVSTPPAAALNLLERRSDDTSPKIVRLSTERNTVSNPVRRDRLRRSETVQSALDNYDLLYFINGSLGTPPQDLNLHIDTGSSDLWVNTPGSDLCSGVSKPCDQHGTYTANSSSTYSYVGSYFEISYVDGSNATGDYAKDTFTVGGSTLDDFQFGIGYTSSTSEGILGIGYPVNEVQKGRAGYNPYKNLPAKMVSSGLIHSMAYSLWLNDLDASRGNILFGGVDKARYHGSLQTIPVQANDGTYAEFLITLTAVKTGDTTIADNAAQAVLLDSGSSLTYLPNDMAASLFEAVGAQYDSTNNAAYIACNNRDSTDTVDFTFSSPVISVEMPELVLDLTTTDGDPVYFSDGEQACLFGVAPAGEGTKVLGDTFLRSAYVVYDLDNNEISLAQTKFNATESDVQEISGAGKVPNATKVTDSVAATAGVSVSSTSVSSSSDGDQGNIGAMSTPLSALALTLICSLTAGLALL